MNSRWRPSARTRINSLCERTAYTGRDGPLRVATALERGHLSRSPCFLC